MNDVMMLGFLDEMYSITKTAEEAPPHQQEENPHLQEDKPSYVRSALNKAKSVGMELAPAVAVPAVFDLMGGRSIPSDLTGLAEKIRNPSMFKGNIGEGARAMFLGPRSEPGHEFLPERGNRGPANLAKHFWKTKGTRLNQAMGVAFGTIPTLMSAYDLRTKEDPAGLGRSRLARALEFGGSLGGAVLGAPHGALGGSVMGMAGGAAGRGLGALADKITGHTPEAPVYEQQVPVLPKVILPAGRLYSPVHP